MIDLVGRILNLTIIECTRHGAWLELPSRRGVVAPAELSRAWMAHDQIVSELEEGKKTRVFLFLDRSERLLASEKLPTACVGEAAFMKAVSSTQFGCFVDWGLPRDLLVPFAEQSGSMEEGQIYAITPYLDDYGRLAGSMRLSHYLRSSLEYDEGERVEGVAWRLEPDIGLFVILDKHFIALMPHTEPHSLQPGQSASFRIANLLPDGKVEVSLRDEAHLELDRDAERLLTFLKTPGRPPIGDASSPEIIHQLVGLSKKAVKRAAGRLLKNGSIRILEDRSFEIAKLEDGTIHTPATKVQRPAPRVRAPQPIRQSSESLPLPAGPTRSYRREFIPETKVRH